ncbi:MAG: aspartate carbamoyltransferase regulatory subunit [Planctomycetota bacterium]
MSEATYHVSALENGTVIDHLRGGTALQALRALALPHDARVTVGINLRSGRQATKDIIKISDYELSSEEAAKVALISPDATLSIIRDFKVAEKHGLVTPVRFRGLVRCPNRNCIIRVENRAGSWMVTDTDPVIARCEYCDHSVKASDFEFA